MDDKRKIARAALFSLKEVVLEMLYEARDGGLINPAEIREHLGIPNITDPTVATNALIFGVLDHLKQEGSVSHTLNEGWEITDEVASLLDDIPSE